MLTKKPTDQRRRELLKKTGLASVVLAVPRSLQSHLWPSDQPSVKHLVIVYARGGVRWTATFDARPDLHENPWGILPWHLVGRGSAPAWGFSRMLVQRPPMIDAPGRNQNVASYLRSDNPENYNLTPRSLSRSMGWKHATLPTIADIAQEIAVVRVTANCSGRRNVDHAGAVRSLCTGYPAGRSGLVTVMQDALEAQLGNGYWGRYRMPSVVVDEPAWALGRGEEGRSQPLVIKSCPTNSRNGHAREGTSDNGGDTTTVQRSVNLSRGGLLWSRAQLTPDDNGDSRLFAGQCGNRPGPTDEMLMEAFGVTSDEAPAGDILFDAFGAATCSDKPVWGSADNRFGLSGALAVRFLQMGTPIVSIAVGGFDTHSFEVSGLQARYPHTSQIVQLTRMLTALEFCLKEIADPTSPSDSLWDSTVVMVCSEFGRSPGNEYSTGFNSPFGAVGGGSDHDPRGAWPIMGGPVRGGRLVRNLKDPGGYFQENSVFTTLMQGMGVKVQDHRYLPIDTFPPIEGLLRDT